MSEERETYTTTPHTRIVRRRGQRLTKAERRQAQATFLDTFANTANIRLSCDAAHIDRSTFYQWLEHDTDFSVDYHQRELEANDALLAAAWERGVHGIEEPLVSMGQVVYDYEPLLNEQGSPAFDKKGNPIMRRLSPLTKRVYSDTVLLRLMSWRIPGFRETSNTTITNVNMQKLERNQLYASMHDDELDQLEEMYRSAQERLQPGGR